MIPQWQQDIINSKVREIAYSLEWIDKNNNVIYESIIDVVDGNVNFDYTKNARRSANITLKNLNKKYIPAPDKLIWINNKVKLKAGYVYNGDKTLLFNQGTYVLGNPRILSSPTKKEINLKLLDKWSLLDGTISGNLMNTTKITVNTRVDHAVKKLMELAGETEYLIEECDVELPYDIEKSGSNTIADFLKEISFIVSYEAFYDVNGTFIFRKALKVEDYKVTPVSWIYEPTDLYLQGSRELEWLKVRNIVQVVGDTLDNGITPIAYARDESTSDMSVSRIGERPEKPIIDTNIFSQELAQDRADWELEQRIMLKEKITINIIPNFSHLEGDVVSATDENNGSNGNYVIRNISYPLTYNPVMTLGIWGIRDWR